MNADVNVGALVASLGMETKEFEKALRDAKKSMDNAEKKMSSSMEQVGKSFDKTGKSMQSFGKSITQNVTLPLGAAATAALKFEKDFEKHMTKIVSLVGVSSEQVSSWRDDVLKLSGEVGRAPQELARGLYFITSAGLRGQEALDVLTASAKASAAGLGDVKLVADNVTSALNAYKNTGLDAAEATDILINAVRLGKVEAEDMAVAMGHVFPVASKLGVSFDQIAAGVASLTRTGTPAETAAVQLRQALGQLIGPAEQAHTALNQLNWSSQEFRRVLAEEGLFPALEQFTEKVDKFGNIEISKKIFGNIRALTGVFDMMGDNIEHNRMIFEEMQDSLGRTNKAFEIVSTTLDHKWNVALSNMKVAAITVGEELKETVIPILNNVADRLRNLVNWWNNLSEEQEDNILRWLKIAAAIGPVIFVFGKLISMIGKTIKGIAALKGAISAVMAGTMTMTGTIGLVVAGLAALGLGIHAVVKNWDNFISKEQRAKNALEDINQAINKQVGRSKALFNELEALSMKEKLDNIQKERKSQLLMEINGRYREYLPFLLDENSSLKQIKEAQEGVNSALASNIALKQSEKQIDSLREKRLQAQQDAYDKVSKRMKKWGFDAVAANEVATEAMKGNANAANEMFKTYVKLQKEDINLPKMLVSPYLFVKGQASDVEKVLRETRYEINYLSDAIERMRMTSKDGVINDDFLQTVSELDKESEQLNGELGNLDKITKGLVENFKKLRDPLKVTFQGLQEDLSKIEGKILDVLASGGPVPQKWINQAIRLREKITGVKDEMQELLWAHKQMPEQLAPLEVPDYEPMEDDLFKPGTNLGEWNMLGSVIAQTREQFQLLGRQAKFFGESEAEILENKMQSIRSILSSLPAGFDENSRAVKYLKEQYSELEEQLDSGAGEKMRSVWEDVTHQLTESNMIMQSLKSSIGDITTALGKTIAGTRDAGDAWQNLATSVIGSVKQIMDALLAKAIAGVISGEVSSKGLPGLITAAAGVAALKAMWDSHINKESSGSSGYKAIPMYADGGIAYGPTIGQFGEYAGVKTNPEVVAPLDRLKSMIGGSYGDWETAHVEVPADKLDITLRRYRNKQNSYR